MLIVSFCVARRRGARWELSSRNGNGVASAASGWRADEEIGRAMEIASRRGRAVPVVGTVEDTDALCFLVLWRVTGSREMTYVSQSQNGQRKFAEAEAPALLERWPFFCVFSAFFGKVRRSYWPRLGRRFLFLFSSIRKGGERGVRSQILIGTKLIEGARCSD
ncbi:hypothetical protein MPH_06713 [Macrophomina phaseolina MS6]|uniref:Uncharacterized protein n=1 Tax=Macrophomina phaseolina (strain MS6) TaxID=1126212 RepID=K2S0K8_MACPH|nr:hypothetical protein MPH_06713 [Macrophomina phaseolina MS6]